MITIRKKEKEKKNENVQRTFCGLAALHGLLFSLSIDGETSSGLRMRREAMPRNRRALGLDFTVFSGVFLILNAFLKSLWNRETNKISKINRAAKCNRKGIT